MTLKARSGADFKMVFFASNEEEVKEFTIFDEPDLIVTDDGDLKEAA